MIMKYLYFIIVLFLYSYISVKADPNMSDTLKVKTDTMQLNFEQKTDAFYIKQNILKNQIEFQNLKLDSIIKQKPVKKFNKTKWVK